VQRQRRQASKETKAKRRGPSRSVANGGHLIYF